MKKSLFSWSVVFVVLGFVGESQASTLYVDVNSVNPISPYSSWGTAATNIQSAVDVAFSGDTVSVTNGHYLLYSEIMVTKDIAIMSINGSDATIVDGNATTRCFNFGSSSSLLCGFTITNGYSKDSGGAGAFCENTAPVVSNCVFSGNSADYSGGGMRYGTANNCVFRENSAGDDGGGMYGGTANNCVFFENSADDDGGGMRGSTANNCTIVGNVAGYSGGGMRYGTANNCIVWGNSTGYGGNDVRDVFVINHSCASDIAPDVNGCITNDPYFANTEFGRFDLLANSPCINAGTNAFASGDSDLAGNPRIVGGVVDIGAYEAPGFPSYSIATATGTNGTIVPPDPLVFEGYDQPVSILPSQGYYVESLTVDGSPVAPVDIYTFSNVQATHSIAATFALIKYDLAVQSGTGDGIYGPGVEVDVVADETPSGFTFSRWITEPASYLSGVSDPYEASTTFTMPTTNIVLSATYTPFHYVDAAQLNDSGDGLSWATAKQTIQAAIELSEINGIIFVTNGIYNLGGDVAPGQSLTNRVCIDKAITVQSVNGPEFTLIEGASGSSGDFDVDAVRGVYIADGAVLSGFMITNGYTMALGYYGDREGGGIFASADGRATNCIITGNSAAYYGGGMRDGTANNCTIVGNSVDGGVGGGMCGGTANNCIISGNSSDRGGGMYEGTANNCAIFGNSAMESGGGIYRGTANNCTIIENMAGSGCGIYRGTANNCIVWYNATGRGYDDNLYNSPANHTCSPEVEHGVDGNITNAPLLVSATYVAPSSPCRGAGSSLYCNGVDVDGEAWLNPPSMGCDEYHGVGSVTGVVEVAIDGTSRVVENYSADFSARIDGPITMHVWDFGDGTLTTNNLYPSHAWGVSGNYAVLLTAFSDTYPEGVSATQVVQVVSQSGSAIHVSVQTGSDANDGLGWAMAKATIQAGVDAQIVHGGIVWVSNGTYAVSFEITVDKNITVQSVNDPDVTIVDGGGSNRCFNLGSSACVVSGLTITNGYSVGNGGGIYCGSTLSVVSNCTITGNSAYVGGGMYNGTANNCNITSNSAGNNGGGFCYGMLNNCIITGNSAMNRGGGSYYGTLSNCLLIGNSAGYEGGGIHGGMLTSCTLTENSANYAGGASSGTLNNCIVWGNSATDYNDIGFATVNYCCASDITAGVNGCITNDPYFVNSATGRFDLSGNSPCINAGSNGFASGSVDLAGNPRIVAGTIDMGAYESPDLPSYAITTTVTGDGVMVPANPMVFEGYDQPISVLPSQGYYIESLSVDDIPAPPAESYTFSDVQSTHSIAATFAIAHYALTVENGTGNGSYTIWIDVDVVADAAPSGFTFLRWTTEPAQYISGLDDPYSASTTYRMPEANVVLTATYGPIYYVDASQSNNSGDGLSWATAKQTIQAAVDLADDGGAVWVTNGTYSVDGAVAAGQSLTNRVCIDTAVTVQSINGPEFTFIEGASGSNGGHDVDSVRGVYIADGATLSGFTVTNGYTMATGSYFDQSGGGIFMTDGGMATNCVLSGNSANDAAGGSYDGTLNTCILANNSANDGGGSYYGTLNDCILNGNSAHGYAGGSYNGILKNCILSGNSAAGHGGGTYSGTLENCTLSENSASGYGGGTYYGTLNNCTLNSNSSASRGGGTYGGTLNNCTLSGNSCVNGGGTFKGTLNNCTLTSNVARYGGGTYQGSLNNCVLIGNSGNIDGGGSYEGTLLNCTLSGNNGGGAIFGTLKNCIVWGNSTSGLDEDISYATAYNTCASDITAGLNGCITNNPLFVDAIHGDVTLQTISPCINMGNNAYVSGAVDLNGNPRIIGSIVDMGAYEYFDEKGDFDVDGLQNGWESLYFENITAAEIHFDSDGDGASNGDEYVSGTDPTNAASYFQVKTDVAEVGNETRFMVEWTAVTGRVYNVFWTPSLTQDFQPLEIGIQYPQHSYTDTVHSAESSGYYRVVVMRSDYDADGDGLPNDWEDQYAVADAYSDGDDDGFNNLAEFISGTDPTNGLSYFTAANSVADVNGTNCFVVEWISIPDRIYSVQWSTNLVSGFQILEANIEYPQGSYTDTTHNAESEGFYKVDIRMK